METRLEPASPGPPDPSEPAAPGPAPPGPAPGAAERALQVHFLTRLGHALSVAGDPVSSTEQTLREVAAGYGLADVEIGVLPTLVLVRARTRGVPAQDLAGAEVGAALRLDQVGALHDIVDLARRGRLAAGEGLERLAGVWATPARFGAPVRVAGHVILTVGLGLILTPRPAALVLGAGLGLLVGLLTELGRRWASLGVLLPVLAATLVSVLVFLATRAGYVVAPLLLLVPPLITFLPGGVLTTAMVELADRHPIAGATRLVAGATQVVLLVFGLVVGQTLVGLPPAEAFAQRTDNLLGWWAPWLGPLVFAAGVHLHFVGPRRALPWLCLSVYVAWVGEQAGARLLGGYLGGFAGAAAMTVLAFGIERAPAAPPFLVLFLPAFWLLVPGALAVVGLTELVGSDPTVALVDLGTAGFTIVAIALGVLVGAAAARALRRGVARGSGWLR
jgi:uncharacterized membrane protein YjjP (DUF1212 family)